jgi:dihydroxy-acid dehydratase
MSDSTRHDHGLARGLTNYGDAQFSLYLRRSFASSMGYSRELLDRPVVGICYAGGGFNNCHRLVPELIEAVKRGVLSAGALPLEFPLVMSKTPDGPIGGASEAMRHKVPIEPEACDHSSRVYIH